MTLHRSSSDTVRVDITTADRQRCDCHGRTAISSNGAGVVVKERGIAEETPSGRVFAGCESSDHPRDAIELLVASAVGERDSGFEVRPDWKINMHTQLTKYVISGLVAVLVGACADAGEGSDETTGSSTDTPTSTDSPTTTDQPSTVSADDSTGQTPADVDSSGGGDTTGGGPVGPDYVCAAAPVGSDVPLIDDFELAAGETVQDNAILLNEGRSGFWYVYNDATEGAVQDPPATMVLPTDETPFAGLYSMRMTGTGFTGFGAGMGLTLNATGGTMGGACPFDATAYTGITFLAKGEGTVRVNFPIPGTVPPVNGGTCAEMCYDNFGTDIVLTADWVRYTLEWSELAQLGFGAPETFDPALLLQLQWQDGSGEVVEIWVDDLAFAVDGVEGTGSGGEESGTGDGSSGSGDGSSGDGSTGT